MNLNDLIDALAGEVEAVRTDLERSLEVLRTGDADDPLFGDAFDQLSGLAQRMGDTAETAGFPGLAAVCAHVGNNALLLPTLAPDERGPLIEFFSLWPPLVAFYLRNLDDPSATAGLVDHLSRAPLELADDEALKIAHQLGSMDGMVNSSFAGLDDSRPIVAAPDDVALDLAEDVDQALLEGFFAEAPQHASYLVQLARNLASGEGDSSDLIAARRVLHTFKGSGSIIGLRGLANLGHHFEDILDHVERAGSQIARPLADALLDAAYCIEQMVQHVLGLEPYPDHAQAVLQQVLDLANRLDRGETIDAPLVRATAHAPLDDASGLEAETGRAPRTAASQAVRPDRAAPSVTASPTAALRVPLERMDELFRVSGEVSVQGAAMESQLKTLAEAARTLVAQNLRVQQRLFELETLVDVRALTMIRARGTGGTGGTAEAGFDPLEMDQYNELHSTAHALMEEAADARTLAARLDESIARTGSVHTRQMRLAKDLQHLVAATRMTEVGALASRLHRNVRSTCQATGKRAELQIEGGDTLIDSDVLNRLADPLLHILRNAVDHGLESPADRLAAGKPETGQIRLVFSRQGQHVVMQCVDDGRGLDFAAIRARAVERGLLAAEAPASDEELARMILMSGFSTRQTINELSGRGVGLDVVREWAAAMNGSIRVSSPQRAGCTLELRFAASLSTMHALVVEAAGQRLALPAAQVVRAVSRGVGRFERLGDSLVYHLSDRTGSQVHPARVLAQAAMMAHAMPDLEQCDAVLVRVDERVHALAVDRLLDARELLIKQPGRYARHLRAVAGLAVLGDGSVAVAVELAQLLTRAAGGSRSIGTEAPARLLSRDQTPGVLIVDDALSVRNSLLEMVRDAGYRAETARDGVEAVQALGAFRPDVVLTDLEMPNMNGIELTAHIRRSDDTRSLPVIMITSRSQDKHRRLAKEAGVDAYFTKPYNEAELLESIRNSVVAA